MPKSANPARVFIADRCKSGKNSSFALLGEPKKKSGEITRKFQASCPAGMGDSIVGAQGHGSIGPALEGGDAGKTAMEWTA
ncbi:hypothetical protein [Litorivita sp. NS0012-18]|uniref:hypothetical protein n=1 Tax=Litorivita sp. NS0012-18 TaxID=3127655 RepID=UPI00310878D2